MTRSILIAPVVLLAGCSLLGGSRSFAAVGATAVDALACAREEARGMGYVVKSLPRADPYAAGFRAERFLEPDTDAARGSVGVLSVTATTGSDGAPRLQVRGERFEQHPTDDIPGGGRFPRPGEGDGWQGPLGPAVGVLTGGPGGDGDGDGWEMKRVSPGEVAWHANQVRRVCSVPG